MCVVPVYEDRRSACVLLSRAEENPLRDSNGFLMGEWAYSLTE